MCTPSRPAGSLPFPSAVQRAPNCYRRRPSAPFPDGAHRPRPWGRTPVLDALAPVLGAAYLALAWRRIPFSSSLRYTHPRPRCGASHLSRCSARRTCLSPKPPGFSHPPSNVHHPSAHPLALGGVALALGGVVRVLGGAACLFPRRCRAPLSSAVHTALTLGSASRPYPRRCNPPLTSTAQPVFVLGGAARPFLGVAARPCPRRCSSPSPLAVQLVLILGVASRPHP